MPIAPTDDFNLDDLKVDISELLVATPDGSDELIDGAVPEVLRLLRQHMQMDVVFVSEFINGRRVFRHVDAAPGKDVIATGQSDPLEESWCQRVVDGRLPELIEDATFLPSAFAPPNPLRIGAHLSTPVVLKDGSVYGTLCCFSFAGNPDLTQRDLKKLQYTAKLTAAKIDRGALVGAGPAQPPVPPSRNP
ncbi:MAG: GAF domain-containing protein [Ramlibacter sp.]|nr:GAF domain-containing protein [Ramlibacter sp.]